MPVPDVNRPKEHEPELDMLSRNASESRTGTIGHRVFGVVRQAIVRGQFKPGHLLSEAELARQLGVSRQPVREAFIKLSEVGLVEIRPQRGTLVLLISRSEVETARFIREAIEIAITRRAADVAGPGDIAGLLDLLDRQEEEKNNPDHGLFLSLDDDFHQSIAAIASCERAWRVIEDLKVQMDRVRFLSLSNATPADTIVSQHRAIVEAIAAHDRDAAEAAVRRHMSEILKSLPQIAETHRAFFQP